MSIEEQSSTSAHSLENEEQSQLKKKLFAPTEEYEALDLPEEELATTLRENKKSEEQAPLPQLPCDLDTYTLTKLYAEGGTARVYRAFESHSKQRYAIKLLRRRFQKDSYISTGFTRHGKALLNIDIPHFAKVVDVGDSPWGPWWALEWLEGETLKATSLQGIHWTSRRLLTLLKQLCVAIKGLHAQGIIHGDIKPDNIIYTKASHLQEEKVTLIDLALPLTIHFADDAVSLEQQMNDQHTDKQETAQQRFKSELMAFGQPIYLAPECLRGEPLSTRSDLYSLGVLMSELTTGTLPFTNKLPKVIFEVLEKKAPSASVRHAPWPYPASLDALISNLLSKAPQDRLSSIDEVLEQLNQMLLLTESAGMSATIEYSNRDLEKVRNEVAVSLFNSETELVDQATSAATLDRIKTPKDLSKEYINQPKVEAHQSTSANVASARMNSTQTATVSPLPSRWMNFIKKELPWLILGMLIAFFLLSKL